MGVYDTYNGIQLKIENCACLEFEIGDEVPIGDGIYVAPDGFVVVVGGKLVATFPIATTKWGDPVTSEQVLNNMSPFQNAVDVGALKYNKSKET